MMALDEVESALELTPDSCPAARARRRNRTQTTPFTAADTDLETMLDEYFKEKSSIDPHAKIVTYPSGPLRR